MVVDAKHLCCRRLRKVARRFGRRQRSQRQKNIAVISYHMKSALFDPRGLLVGLEPTQSPKAARPCVSGTFRKRRFCGFPDAIPGSGICSPRREQPENTGSIPYVISVRRIKDNNFKETAHPP